MLHVHLFGVAHVLPGANTTLAKSMVLFRSHAELGTVPCYLHDINLLHCCQAKCRLIKFTPDAAIRPPSLQWSGLSRLSVIHQNVEY